MKVRRLDGNWDYCFGRGLKDYVEGVDAVGQAVKMHLLLLYHEWWEDLEDGLPLFEKVLGRRNNLDVVDLVFKERILDTQGVLSITSYSSELINKKYNFTAVIETLYGQLVIANEEVG